MPFTREFGGELGEILGRGLSGLAEGYAQKKKQEQQSKLLSQLLAGSPGQQPLIQPGQQGGFGTEQFQQGSAPVQQRSTLPASLGQVKAAALQAGLSPEQIKIIEDEYARREKQQQLEEKKETKQKELELQKEKLELQKEEAANRASKSYTDSLRGHVDSAKDLRNPVKNALELFQDPSLQIGPLKSLIPSRAQNAATQQLASYLNEIVIKKSQLGKGVPNKQRLILEKLSKADTWQKPETIKKLLTNLDNQINKTIREEKVKDDLIEEFGRTPSNLETKVKKRLKLTKGFPAAKDFQEDTIIEVNGKKFKPVGDVWRPL